MSGAAFEGLPRPAQGSLGDDYEPGILGFNPSAVDRLIALWESGDLFHLHIEDPWERLATSVGQISSILGDKPVGKPDALIEAVIHRLSLASDLDRSDTEDLLDPLVQALYEAGHNNFAVDLTPLHWPESCAMYLSGTQERPLVASYAGKVSRVASCCSSVDLTFHIEGYVQTIGQQSKDSRMVMRARCGSVGWKAESCEFTLLGRMGSINPYENHGCVFRTDNTELVEVELDDFWEQGFFSRGNTLYVPDGKGSWKEVGP